MKIGRNFSTQASFKSSKNQKNSWSYTQRNNIRWAAFCERIAEVQFDTKQRKERVTLFSWHAQWRTYENVNLLNIYKNTFIPYALYSNAPSSAPILTSFLTEVGKKQ